MVCLPLGQPACRSCSKLSRTDLFRSAPIRHRLQAAPAPGLRLHSATARLLQKAAPALGDFHRLSRPQPAPVCLFSSRCISRTAGCDITQQEEPA